MSSAKIRGTMKKTNHDARMTIRLTKELHEALKASAERNKRSINDHVLWILENYISDENRQVGDLFTVTDKGE